MALKYMALKEDERLNEPTIVFEGDPVADLPVDESIKKAYRKWLKENVNNYKKWFRDDLKEKSVVCVAQSWNDFLESMVFQIEEIDEETLKEMQNENKN